MSRYPTQAKIVGSDERAVEVEMVALPKRDWLLLEKLTKNILTTRGVIADERAVDTAEAAEFLGLEVAALRKWRQQRIGPRFVRYGRRVVRYPLAELRHWRDAQMAKSG